MASEDSVQQEEKLIEIVEEHVWNNLGSLKHVPYGYKTRKNISQRVRGILEDFSVEDDLTARYIRHTPNAFVVQRSPKLLYLVDYKCMTVPMCDDLTIEKVSQNAGRRVEADNIVEIDTASYKNYVALKNLGVKVAILTYIAYHDQLLRCDFIQNIEAIRPYEDGNEHTEENGVPSVNFDVTQMRTLEDFLVKEHRIIPAYIAPKIQAACSELVDKIGVNHDSGSVLAW